MTALAGSAPPLVSSLEGQAEALDHHGRADRLRSARELAIWFEHLPQIEWGAESTVVNGLALGFLIALSQQPRLRPMVGSPQAVGPAHQRKPQPLPESPVAGRRSTPADREAIGRLVIAFAEALKDHLRHRDGSDEAGRGDWTEDGTQSTSRAGWPAPSYETVVRWQREGRTRRLGAALARRAGEEPDGYLRRLRADSQHAAFIVLSRSAPPRDRALPGRSPRFI